METLINSSKHRNCKRGGLRQPPTPRKKTLMSVLLCSLEKSKFYLGYGCVSKIEATIVYSKKTFKNAKFAVFNELQAKNCQKTTISKTRFPRLLACDCTFI